ncbi:LANO_0G13124g1_1 [Lachancea nothofagi CBS 11611]|uniref:LANO_0G13124g1_1 n=1 Tax=Lachancea nothofagi CBS 11611 TaxID=1266666 RepID=A0A1G4KK59_9SACH|nr:LANO_0G13124g1_1 [Lachancea nothofagi CBS 11611]
MLDHQLYILACFLAARANVSGIEKLLLSQKRLRLADILSIICVLWPELDEPANFGRLLVHLGQATSEEVGLLESLIEGDDELISAVQMDPEALQKRRCTLQEYVDSRVKKTGVTIEDSNWRFNFLKLRVLTCNTAVGDPMFYKSLWCRLSVDKYQEFLAWVTGIVKPLGHFNKRCRVSMLISDFQSCSSFEVLGMIWKSIATHEISTYRAVLTYEIMPYLNYTNSFDIFLEIIFNQENFPLDSLSNYNIYKMISLEMLGLISEDFRSRFEHQVVSILYENGRSLTSLQDLDLFDEHHLILSSVKDDIVIKDQVDVSTLTQYSDQMDLLRIFNLKDIKKLTEDTELAQRSCFSTTCKQLLRSNVSYKVLEKLGSFMQNDFIFGKLDSKLKELIIVESLLDFGKFDVLEQFIAASRIRIEDTVLLKFFWNFFNSASNGGQHRPDMVNARKILDLLPKNKYAHLSTLLSVVDRLSRYSLRLSPGLPFKPSVLLELGTQPFDIISKLLELNESLRKNVDETFDILKGLYVGLELNPSPNFYEEFTRILVLHIEFSLAFFDFEFAVRETKALLKRHNCQKYWSTILQVGKFFDPSWSDSEIPTEVIYLQLEVLENLLHICPQDELEAVVSQWSGLELELSSRDLVNDPYSLANGRFTAEFKTIMLDEASPSASNFLSSSVKWVTGGDM